MAFFILVAVSYACGCINGAYYIGHMKYKQDIRTLGSANAGARNAGRIFGKKAFIGSVAIDALKTIIPLAIGRMWLDVSDIVIGAMALAILIGHIWPLQLQRSGGKGVVVYLAAALVLAPLALVVCGLALAALRACKQSFTKAGLIAICTIPLTLLCQTAYSLAGLFALLLMIVLFAHRKGH